MFDDQILGPCLLQASVGCLTISGQNRTISGQRLNIMGQRLTISGQILMISGQEIMAGFCLIISGQSLNISGQRLIISGQSLNISGQSLNNVGRTVFDKNAFCCFQTISCPANPPLLTVFVFLGSEVRVKSILKWILEFRHSFILNRKSPGT